MAESVWINKQGSSCSLLFTGNAECLSALTENVSPDNKAGENNLFSFEVKASNNLLCNKG